MIVESTNDVNKNLRTELKYPTNSYVVGMFPYSSMVEKNILTPVVEKVEYFGDEELSTAKNSYSLNNNIVLLDSLQLSRKNSPLETRIRYHNYDSYGNPVYISKDNGEKVVYLWSYYGQYPVAKIENATYNQVNALLNIESLSKSITPNMPLVERLRSETTLARALITTYTYKPLVGIISVTDPRGVKSTYEYDGMGRLKNVKDFEDNIVQAYKYNYAIK